MAIPLSLLLISCSLYSMSMSSPFSPSSLALLLLLLLSFLFSNLRHLLLLPAPAPRHRDMDLGHGKAEAPEAVESPPEATEDDGDSASDGDESLIEISLPGGHYVEEEGSAWEQEQGLLADFLPDLVHDRSSTSSSTSEAGFTDFLSEIMEEENLIEIDIARGSIKCSGFGIEA